MTISVITESWNNAATIAETLRSVALQSWQDCDHLLIDGGSTADTLGIATRYPHLASVESEPDEGIYDAMNKGVARASGDVVGPFSTSYRIAPDFEWMVRAFAHRPLQYWRLSEVMVRMRMGGVSTAGIRSTITLNREMLRACRQNGLRTNLPTLLARYPWKLAERHLK